MDWKNTDIQYTEGRYTYSVARAAFTMEFYADGSRLAPHGEALFDQLLSLFPQRDLLYKMGMNDHQYKRADARGLRRIRSTLGKLEQKGQSYLIKDTPEFDAGQHSIDLDLGSKQKMISDTVVVALPLESTESTALAQTRAIFEHIVSTFPFWAAVAAYGYNMVWGNEFEQVAEPAMHKLGMRFHGPIIRNRAQEKHAVKRLKSVGWLTFVDGELLAQAGGEAHITEQLDAQVSTKRIRDGLLLQAGPQPPLGDVNVGAPDIAPMASVSRALSPVRLRAMRYTASGIPQEKADSWIKRFD